MITVKSVTKQFGGVHAVHDASLNIAKGSITGLIGPNGAGKTTLFNIIAGNIKPTSGTILLDGEDVTGLPPHDLFEKGLLRTFQIAHEFSTLTVLENLMMVPGDQAGESLLNAWFSFGEVRQQEKLIRERAMEVIDFLNLTHLTQELAGNLSGGQKKLRRTGPHHDGRRQGGAARRGRRRRQPHASQRPSATRSSASTESAATPSA
jgi:branched-chain amino acid transport system ATP-binding protein